MKVLFVCVVLLPLFIAGKFVDVTSQAGIHYQQQPPHGEDDLDCLSSQCSLQDVSGGAAIADFDGWSDIYVTRLFTRNGQGENIPISDILYRNQGDGTFKDVTSQVGLDKFVWYSAGPLFCDFDNDGDLDLFVTTISPLEEASNPKNRFYLFIYENGKYVEKSYEWGVDQDDGTVKIGKAASCGDLNNDGLMDLFVSQWYPQFWPEEHPLANHTKLYINKGDHFEDITTEQESLDIILVREHNFAGEFLDWNKDGHVDLLVSADFKRSQYFMNDGHGNLIFETKNSLCCTGSNDMGTAFGDIDNNGQLDWFLTSMGLFENEADDPSKICNNDICGNRLFLNDNGIMMDVTSEAGVRRGGWGWGASFFDMENDGDLDLAMTNGMVSYPLTASNGHLWENVNGVLNGLANVTLEQGFIDPYGFGLALLTLDYDNDGDLDVFISHDIDGGTLFRNDNHNNNDWMKIKTPGKGAPSTNHFGKGVQITIMVDNIIHYQEMGVTSPLMGHSENTIAHFGLGKCRNGKADSVTVYFPVTDTTHHLTDVLCNQLVVIPENGDFVYETSFSSEDTSRNNNESSSSDSSSSWVILPCLLCV